MFVPRRFASSDLRVLDRLVARDAFATLVSTHEGAPFATHLPVLYQRDGERVQFLGHWSRANPQWQSLHGQTALLMLHGPHAYVSPSWYEAPRTSVPTWNYVTAHVYGKVRVSQEPAEMERIVTALAQHYESTVGSNWRFEKVEPEVKLELRGIVGFEIVAERVELKLKLNQHHPEANVRGAIAGLRAQNESGSHETADWMEQALAQRT